MYFNANENRAERSINYQLEFRVYNFQVLDYLDLLNITSAISLID